MKHELKTFPEKFEKILANKHMTDLRINDREYQSGDEILYREWTRGNKYTGRSVLTKIVGVSKGPWPPPMPIIEKIIREEYRVHHLSSFRMRRKPIPDIPDYVIIDISLIL